MCGGGDSLRMQKHKYCVKQRVQDWIYKVQLFGPGKILIYLYSLWMDLQFKSSWFSMIPLLLIA